MDVSIGLKIMLIVGAAIPIIAMPFMFSGAKANGHSIDEGFLASLLWLIIVVVSLLANAGFLAWQVKEWYKPTPNDFELPRFALHLVVLIFLSLYITLKDTKN